MSNNTVIIGAGIIGTSTAYYLSLSGSTLPGNIHLVETSPRLFASASGYAAGFLAADWYGPATASLGALSFRLHKELAAENDGRERWGYSGSTGTSMVDTNGKDGTAWCRQGGSRAEAAGQHEFVQGEGPAWLINGKAKIISEDTSTAQVDPPRLCRFLLGESLERGVRLHHPAKAISVAKDLRGELASIRIVEEGGSETDIPCTRLIITAGAWTPQVFSTLFPTSSLHLPITSLAGHSVVVRTPRWAKEHEAGGCHAVFCTDSQGYSPEVFSRIGGDIYFAGLNDANIPLPEVATDAKPHPESIKILMESCRKMLSLPGGVDDLEVVREGLCFRPVTDKGVPIVSRVPDKKLGSDWATRGGGEGGVFVSAGHGPWGIAQSLGTGKVLAELVEGKPTSADIKHLGL